MVQYLRYCFAVPSGPARLLTLDVNAYLRSNDEEERDVVDLAVHLCALGYEAHLEHTHARETRRYLQSAAKHTFIVVRLEEEEYMVDIQFREQFAMPRPTARYVAVLDLVPAAFVGTRARLLSGARAVWREMEMAFAHHDMTPLPPWRKEERFLARWCLARWDADAAVDHHQRQQGGGRSHLRQHGEDVLQQVRATRERENMEGEITRQLRRMDDFRTKNEGKRIT